MRPQIYVKAINPGIVETEGTHTAGFISAEFFDNAAAQRPLGLVGQPGDISGIAVFLVSHDARGHMNDQAMVVRAL